MYVNINIETSHAIALERNLFYKLTITEVEIVSSMAIQYGKKISFSGLTRKFSSVHKHN